ncbi:hypothetical protein LSI01_06200 [Furfurilactobacillus siliginis]|uniref:Uncharacterized protein n=1 Tax=Furfurilactobacillus siliginis TaxID=348151 RepID=A0A510VN10_9LACO|nr:hypothetical protein LSI01_06200 [Furfurilactobacillus siliginis]
MVMLVPPSCMDLLDSLMIIVYETHYIRNESASSTEQIRFIVRICNRIHKQLKREWDKSREVVSNT